MRTAVGRSTRSWAEVTAVAGPSLPPVDEEDYRWQVGKRVRLVRVHLDLSQDEVAARAAKAGVSRNFVSAIERGAQGLDTWRLRHIAEALGVPLAWLLALPGADLTSQDDR